MLVSNTILFFLSPGRECKDTIETMAIVAQDSLEIQGSRSYLVDWLGHNAEVQTR